MVAAVSRANHPPSALVTSLLNGVDYTVVGIAPPGLPFLASGDIWTPLTIDPGKEIRLNHVINVIGRLRPGVTPKQAQTEMDLVAARVGAVPLEVKDWGVEVLDFTSSLIVLEQSAHRAASATGRRWLRAFDCLRQHRQPSALLHGRIPAEERLAVRAALGASRNRMLAQFLTESLLLSTAGGVTGLAAAFSIVRIANRSLPQGLLPATVIGIDSSVLFFALGITLATGLLFGLAPAWHAVRTDLNTVLKQGSRSSIGGQRLILRNGLVAGELALATVLLVGAGLLMQSLLRLQQVRPSASAPREYSPFSLRPFRRQISEPCEALGALSR